MAETVRATAYLVVKGDRSRYGGAVNPATGLRPVDTAKITTARQSRPGAMQRDEILVKVTVELPADAFDPIAPAALIVVPEGMVLARHVLKAEATAEGEEG